MKLPSTSRLLPLILCFSVANVYALEALEDDSLSQVTGEGVAYLPENFKIVFDDTAYVRTLPDSATVTFGERAELVWYGLAFAGTDGNVSDRVGNAIPSWGTANNPWILNVNMMDLLSLSLY